MLSCLNVWARRLSAVGVLVASCASGLASAAPALSAAAAAPLATELPAPVREALRQAQVPLGAISVQVQSLPSTAPTTAPTTARTVWLSHRSQEAMNPASLMKLLTTYAALDLLGPEHVWQTQVYTDTPVQAPAQSTQQSTGQSGKQDGVLQGTLYLRGSGDPKLVLERVQELVAQIRAAGVQEVRGDIVLDRSVLDVAPRSEPFDDEPWRPYNVAPDGFLMNFGAVTYTFTPEPAVSTASTANSSATPQVRVRSEPPLMGLQISAQLSASAGPCLDWRSKLQADLSEPLRPRFSGTYPSACGERSWPLAFGAPEQYAPRMFEALWRQAGGSLHGQVRWGQTPAQAKPLLRYPSLPLKALVADINKMSNNVMAQQVFLSLSAQMGAPGRMEASRLRLGRWWRERFADLPEPVLDNGSGLSRHERSSAAALSALLQHAWGSPLREDFVQSLAVAGVDGTVQRLKERLPHSPVLGRAWLKTGSLRDVASVAGVVQGESGRHYSVVAIINHPQAGQARAALDQLLDWTARDRQR